MDTKKKPLFIAFSSQKGGVGKSTFTTLVASTMHYRLGYNVAVFDADFPHGYSAPKYTVCCSLIASMATLALKPALNFLRSFFIFQLLS